MSDNIIQLNEAAINGERKRSEPFRMATVPSCWSVPGSGM